MRLSCAMSACLGFVSTRHCETWTWLLNQLHLRSSYLAVSVGDCLTGRSDTSCGRVLASFGLPSNRARFAMRDVEAADNEDCRT